MRCQRNEINQLLGQKTVWELRHDSLTDVGCQTGFIFQKVAKSCVRQQKIQQISSSGQLIWIITVDKLISNRLKLASKMLRLSS